MNIKEKLETRNVVPSFKMYGKILGADRDELELWLEMYDNLNYGDRELFWLALTPTYEDDIYKALYDISHNKEMI